MDKGKKHVDLLAPPRVNDIGEGTSFALKSPSPIGKSQFLNVMT